MYLGPYSYNPYDEYSQNGWDSSYKTSSYKVRDNYVSVGTLSSSFDRDYYEFSTLPSYSYTITLTSDANYYGWSTFTNDSYLSFKVTDYFGTTLLNSQYLSLYDDQAVFIPSNSYGGTYYVEVYTTGFGSSDYALTLDEQYYGPVNNPAIWSPTISGDHTVGSTISVGGSFFDLDGYSTSLPLYYFYRINEDGSLASDYPIQSGPSNSYTLVEEDIGKRVGVAVTIYDDLNNFETSLVDWGYYNTGQLVSAQPNTPAIFTNFSLDSDNGGDYVVGESITANVDYSDSDGISGPVIYYFYRTNEQEFFLANLSNTAPVIHTF